MKYTADKRLHGVKDIKPNKATVSMSVFIRGTIDPTMTKFLYYG